MGAVPTGIGAPTFLQQMYQWMQNPNISMFGRWEGHPEGGFEGGVDLPSPGGTPVYALATGFLEGAGNFWHGGGNCLYQGGAGCTPGYGVVTERVNVPGFGLQDLYYQHIQIAPGIQNCQSGNCGGTIIKQGQLLGYVTNGVNEVEMGLNANWGGVWGGAHPAGWYDDPRLPIATLMTKGGLPVPSSAAIGGGPSSGGSCPAYCLGFNFKNPLDPNATAQCLPDFPGCSGCCGNPNVIGANANPGVAGQNTPPFDVLSGINLQNLSQIGVIVFGGLIVLIAIATMFR